MNIKYLQDLESVIKILYVGDKWLGSNARSLANGFRKIGHDVVHVDTTSVNLPKRFSSSWARSKMTSGRDPLAVARLHDVLSETCQDFQPDLVFCYKTIYLDQDKIFQLGTMPKIHYSADDISNPYNTTEEYLSRENLWSAIVTTKEHNVKELQTRGVENPIFVLSAYDPSWHHPTARPEIGRYDVGFLGNRRPDRVGLLHKLAIRYGGNIRIGGPGWRRDTAIARTGARISPPAYGESFSEFVSTVNANLVLLNSENRDTHTCRSFEVPAAGGLFVGERTLEHQMILEEGREALFFSNEEELFEILNRTSSDTKWANEVAARGYERIISTGNTYADRAKQIIDELPIA